MNMRKLLALLLATTAIGVGSVGFTAGAEETGINDTNATAVASAASRWNNWDNLWSSDWDSQEVSVLAEANIDRDIPSDSAGFFLQLDGLQMDSNGNIEGRPTTYFTDIVAIAKLANRRWDSFAIALGDGITEEHILAEVTNPPTDDEAFDAARDQLMYKGYIRSNKGEVVPWSKLKSKYYGIEWYVFKHENDGWHIDGRIIDLATDDTIDIVIPEDPKDIPDNAYDEDDEDNGDNNGEDNTEEQEDTSISLKGSQFAYIFGYAPVIRTVTDEDGNEHKAADIYMGMDDSVTVEQVASMLVRLLDQEGHTSGMMLKVTPSIEAHRGEWYARGLAYQCKVGGLDADTPFPLGDVTRGLVAKLVSRALQLNLSSEVPFTDTVGSQYEEDIKKVYAYGYMKGVSATEFAPNDIMTRAEFCQLFNNIIGRNDMGLTALDQNGNEYEVTPADYSIVDMSPSHWAYKVCLKATSAYDDNGYVSFSKRQENIRNKLDEYNDQLLY